MSADPGSFWMPTGGSLKMPRGGHYQCRFTEPGTIRALGAGARPAQAGTKPLRRVLGALEHLLDHRLNLEKSYAATRLDRACRRALSYGLDERTSQRPNRASCLEGCRSGHRRQGPIWTSVRNRRQGRQPHAAGTERSEAHGRRRAYAHGVGPTVPPVTAARACGTGCVLPSTPWPACGRHEPR